MAKCLKFVLTLIPPNKILFALKEFITSNLLNTKFFAQKKLNN